MAGVSRRPLVVLGLTALLALAGAALALRLEPSAATETLVDQNSETFQATERFKDDFGDEAVLVLVRGELTRTVLTADLGRLVSLEGCLSGNVPDRKEGLGSLPPVCRDIAELDPAQVVFGPGTFINTSARQINGQLAVQRQAADEEAARVAAATRKLSKRRGDPPAEQRRLAAAAANAVQARFINDTLRTALRFGLTGVPSIYDQTFVSTVVFDRTAGEPGVPKSRFAYLFPSKNAAMITVRLKPGLSDTERNRAIELIRTAVGQKMFKPREGARYIVSGVPVVAEALADEVQRAIFVLLGAALLLMAATLALVFRSRLRLLPLGARARGGGDDLRGAPARGRQPHDGIDRRAPGPDRARGGLRDPVPVALRRSGGARGGGARGGGRRGGRAHHPHGRPRHRRRLPRPAAVARCRWCGASAACSWWAS